MAKFIPIYTKIWSDSKFKKLTAEEKLIFLYIGWNENVTLCGIYDFDIDITGLYTSYSKETIKSCIEKLKPMVLIDEEVGLAYVKNHFKYQPKSPQVITSVVGELNQIKDHPFKDEFVKTYGLYLIPYMDRLHFKKKEFIKNIKVEHDEEEKIEYLKEENITNLLRIFTDRQKVIAHLKMFGFAEAEIISAIERCSHGKLR